MQKENAETLYVDIPLSEKWLYENEVAFKKVKKGLQQSREGKTTSKGSFSKYTKEEA